MKFWSNRKLLNILIALHVSPLYGACQLDLENNTPKTVLVVPMPANRLLPQKNQRYQGGGIIIPAYATIKLGNPYTQEPGAYAFYEQNPRTNQFTLYHTLYEQSCDFPGPVLYEDIEKNHTLQPDVLRMPRLLIDKR
jgi:hypothetical protein